VIVGFSTRHPGSIVGAFDAGQRILESR